MPTVRVNRFTPGFDSVGPGKPPRHPKVEIRDGKGDITITLPFAPREVSHSGFARTWQVAERIGRKPILTPAGKALRTVNLELVLAHPDHQTGVEGLISKLEKLARKGRRIRFRRYGDLEGGWWRITDLNINVVLRQAGTNRATRALATLTLTEDVEVEVKVSPVKNRKRGGGGGGGRDDDVRGRDDDDEDRGGGRKGGAKWPKVETVKAGPGFSFAAIATKYYGSPNAWGQIADHNKVRDPRPSWGGWKGSAGAVKAGTRLSIPKPKPRRR